MCTCIARYRLVIASPVDPMKPEMVQPTGTNLNFYKIIETVKQ